MITSLKSNLCFPIKKQKKKEKRTHQINPLEKLEEFLEALLEYTSTTNYTDVLTFQNNLLSVQLESTSN
ncbi:hypothetical protein [Cellulophaga sp. L1A9]|uniref:hypothetical protein n=1 Tax=Cellulophaga sp. L1A9 TaxID=2686362 RepID=UPI00131B19D5|nr:hypothetical protein [Cellulophaga sp. L1A9]